MRVDLDQYVIADELLAGLSSMLDVTYANPANGQDEKKKFFESLAKGREYNPLYRYAVPHKQLADGEQRLSHLKFDSSLVGRIFADLVDETRRRIRMVASVGTDDFTSRGVDVYGTPSPILIKTARSILQSMAAEAESGPDSLTTEELAQRFQNELDKLGTHWKIEITLRACAKVNVIPGQEKIELRAGERFSEAEARRLIVHEINAHLYRALNGSSQPFRIFATGLADNERTDEGLATIIEELTETIRNTTFRIYAGRVLGVHLSQTKSFYDVFCSLRDYFHDQDAFYITQRVKRGLSKTELPGGLVKDYIYLDGREKLRRYLEEGGELRLLYCGNVSVQATKTIEQLLHEKVLAPPRYLPDFLGEQASTQFAKTLRRFAIDV